jgi:nucleotide-binding universal stress UspA family protein
MVCVDGSEAGYKAADFAIAVAAKLGSKIHFFNVVGASTSEKNYKITADMAGSFQRLGDEALSKCEGKARVRGLQFETEQVDGDPAEEILKYAKESKVDCIVLGRQGLTDLEKLLLGSVSEKVLKFCDLPVILIK